MNAPATYSTQAQAAALRRRARIGIAFAAACNNQAGFDFWQGYAAAASDLLDGKSADMARRDAGLANQPQTRHEAAGAALPKSTKNLTLAQVRQILATQRAEVAADAVPDIDFGAREVLKDDMVAGVDGNDEHAVARVHMGDGADAHSLCSASDEAAIVAQEAGADSGNGPDPLYERAVDLVRAPGGKASISYVQRHLRIGYNRTARILEAMEKAGIIGHQDAFGMREVTA